MRSTEKRGSKLFGDKLSWEPRRTGTSARSLFIAKRQFEMLMNGTNTWYGSEVFLAADERHHNHRFLLKLCLTPNEVLVSKFLGRPMRRSRATRLVSSRGRSVYVSEPRLQNARKVLTSGFTTRAGTTPKSKNTTDWPNSGNLQEPDKLLEE